MEEIVASATKSQEDCSAKITAKKDELEADLKTKVEEIKGMIVQQNLEELEESFEEQVANLRCQ